MWRELSLPKTVDYIPSATIKKVSAPPAGRTFAAALGELAYRIVRRATKIELSRLLSLNLAALRPPRSAPFDIDYRFLDADEVRSIAAGPAHDLDAAMAERLRSGRDFCFAAFAGDRLASYCWFAVDSIEPAHSCGAGLKLPPDTIYLYKVFTVPAYRGREIHGAAFTRAARHFQERGITKAIAIIEHFNRASLRSHEKLGFRFRGCVLRIGRKGLTWGCGELVRKGRG